MFFILFYNSEWTNFCIKMFNFSINIYDWNFFFILAFNNNYTVQNFPWATQQNRYCSEIPLHFNNLSSTVVIVNSSSNFYKKKEF